MGSSGLSECSGVPVFRMSGSQRRDAVAGGSGEHCLWRESEFKRLKSYLHKCGIKICRKGNTLLMATVPCHLTF